VRFERLPNVVAKCGGVPVMPHTIKHGESQLSLPTPWSWAKVGITLRKAAEIDQALAHAGFLGKNGISGKELPGT
jgi:hypothetical protein